MRVSVLVTLILLISIPVFAQFPNPTPYNPCQHLYGWVEGDWLASSDVETFATDVNLNFDIGAWKEVHFAFGGGMLVLADTDDQMYQPNRFRGTLEPQAYIMKGCNVYLVSLRHQSFHTMDCPATGSESFELINASYLHKGDPNIWVRLGKYINMHGVDYNWNALIDVDSGYLGRGRYHPFYARGLLEYVRETGQIPDRDQFVNYTLEAGFQSCVGVRYYTAYRQIADIDQFNGLTDHEWALGIRYMW